MKTNRVIIRAVTAAQSVGFHRWVREVVEPMGFKAISLSSPGPDAEALQAEGWRVETVPMERHISPLRDLRSLWRLVRVFRRERPTMVHSMTPKAGLLCMLAAWLCRVPVRVHTFTGLVFPTATGLTRRILMLTDSITCACATHIIPEGEGVRRDLLNHGITRKPIRVLGYGNCQGIDLEYFNPANREIATEATHLRKSGTFTFIAVGRLVGDKGINELVAAFARLHCELPNTRLILVGRTEPDLDSLRQDTEAEIDRNPAIEAVGQQNDVRPWFAAADCAILASYREGFPNVVIEAGAMGLPQIVTNINGANEIITDGINGIIIPAHDTDAILLAMQRIIREKDIRARMSDAARPSIAARFEQTFVRQCLLEYYKEILTN